MAGEQFQVPSSGGSGTDSPENGERKNAQDENASGIEKQLQHRPPHQAVGFWHPHMSKVRAHVLQLWARTGMFPLLFPRGNRKKSEKKEKEKGKKASR